MAFSFLLVLLIGLDSSISNFSKALIYTTSLALGNYKINLTANTLNNPYEILLYSILLVFFTLI
jgi:hypothetical protein